MTETVDFTACKWLDFDDHFLATKNLISNFGITKVVWQRQNGQLCQFCQKRGRINQPDGCLTERQKQCQDYEELNHSIPISTIDLT